MRFAPDDTGHEAGQVEVNSADGHERDLPGVPQQRGDEASIDGLGEGRSMSNKYEDLIKNARMNADCGEHMSPAEVTTLLNVVEITFAAGWGSVRPETSWHILPSKRETPAGRFAG
jgi:hypothetical protein